MQWQCYDLRRRPKCPSHPGPLTVPLMCWRWPVSSPPGHARWQSPLLHSSAQTLAPQWSVSVPWVETTTFFWYVDTAAHTIPVPNIKLSFLSLFLPVYTLHSPVRSLKADRWLVPGSSTSTSAVPCMERVCIGAFLNEGNQWMLCVNRMVAPEFPNRWAWIGEARGFYCHIRQFCFACWFVTGQKHCKVF